MIRLLPRAAAAAILGAFAAAAWLVLIYALFPSLTIDMSADTALAQGLYPVENTADGTFAWTGPRAEISLPGLDRRSDWLLTIRMRGGRPDASTLPDVAISIDGVEVLRRKVENTFQDVAVHVPRRDPLVRGTLIGLDVSNIFVPGSQDTRRLGIQIDRMALAPEGIALPPRRATAGAAIAAAVLGFAFGLLNVTSGGAIGGAVVLGAGQAVMLGRGIAPYSAFPIQAVWLAFWIALAIVIITAAVERRRRQPLRNTARFAAAFSAGAVYLELLALLHPSAVPGYALFVTDPRLFRIILGILNAVAGALMYVITVRIRGDRLAAAIAVALYHFVAAAVLARQLSPVFLFVLPPIVSLAGASGTAWMWRRGLQTRAAAIVVLAWAVWSGIRAWTDLVD